MQPLQLLDLTANELLFHSTISFILIEYIAAPVSTLSSTSNEITSHSDLKLLPFQLLLHVISLICLLTTFHVFLLPCPQISLYLVRVYCSYVNTLLIMLSITWSFCYFVTFIQPNPICESVQLLALSVNECI